MSNATSAGKQSKAAPATVREPVDLTAKLRKVHDANRLGRFISHIRFPRFKNIRTGARIDFSFPVTAFVGPNGSGKTSALHALYGAPKGMSTSDFWFATDVDPIKEGNGEPNRFIYGHWLDSESMVVETRKARVGASKHRKPGYFEPTKAVKGDGMDTSPFPASGKIPGQSKDRWNPVERPLVYINFRSELSAFDKYLFWAAPIPTKTLKSKHDRLQLGAKRLKQVMESGMASTTLRGKPAVFENRNLTATELFWVCYVLGKDYAEARLVRHAYYGDKGVSVRFTRNNASYSEAFAGSGELAVTSLVVQLCSAEKNSLVLLDEPEVSLHPGAQERLLLFLMEESLRQRHQVVFTTHSPALIRHLPSDAIKVFFETPDGTFDIVSESHPYAAFISLGAPAPKKIRILVEDRLAKSVVEVALLELPPADRSLFEVAYLPGGADTYFAHRISTLMHEETHTHLFLDGDKRPATPIPDPATIPESENGKLHDLIKLVTGCSNIQFGADGGSDPDIAIRRIGLQRKYLKFLHERVHFLPRQCPEQIVLASLPTPVTTATSGEAKEMLSKRAFAVNGSDSAEGIDAFARVKLGENRAGNADIAEIVTNLQSLLVQLPD